MSCEKWAKAYEAEHGKRPPGKTMRLVRHIDKVSGMLREQGCEDAEHGYAPCSAESFARLTKDVFENISEEAAEYIGNYWHDEYMIGYQTKGGAA